ncbi:MAG: peptide chain release factor N(5)-glutamine methyltransferase [Burkholderiales bacterium]
MNHTLAQALVRASAQAVDRLDAQLLMLKVLMRGQTERAWLIAHDDHVLTPSQWREFEQLLLSRSLGQPLAYLVGEKEFFGLTLTVSAHVLIPRPDTETLVEWALNTVKDSCLKAPAIVDLGTGSGAVALAIKANAPHAQVTALDLSPDALALARLNGQRLQLDVRWMESNWLQGIQGLQTRGFDVVVSNPPYIEENDPHLAQLLFEPVSALTAGADGLRDIRTIIQQAPSHLNTNGWLLLEHGWNQANAVAQLLTQQGFTDVQSRTDLGGNTRCTGGKWVFTHT